MRGFPRNNQTGAPPRAGRRLTRRTSNADEHGRVIVRSTGDFRESHMVITVTPSRSPDPQGGTVLSAAEVIDTLLIFGPTSVAASVAATPAAVYILHNQPELPEPACITAGEPGLTTSEPVPVSCRWLTARANLSSDDLAVIRHALTAVAEVKVRA
ncbi:hypothetical protein [Nonomuraea sp. NEAU-A123]|uniref:hypothetical protein n=1 Tax=Nonomuraea sp. NEAU-A123 TaxID=2839649 RepID=UPI001BE434BB|nr:hypothetical protein [Nonomuraea sp. NEAU-A123]MBT2231344.1 hypothetical protein [Nonomuraea sp. NEAU-A123]